MSKEEKKQKLTAEEEQLIAQAMKIAATSPDREKMTAELIGDVYDEEMKVSPVIEAVSVFGRAGNRPGRGGADNKIHYMTPDSIDKKVFAITSDCTVEQQKVTPNTKETLTLVPLITEDYWVCLTDFLSGDHDVLEFYAKSIREALDRKEIKNVLAVLDAAAVAESNTFILDSGVESFDFPKLISMRKSLRKYGTEYVLITGENVQEDVDLMDYTANTFRPYTLETLRIRHIPVLSFTVDTDDSGQEALIDPDVAYLVAVKDANGDMPVVAGRRSVSLAADVPGTQATAKDTLIIDTGNVKPIVGGSVKYGRGKAGYREFGAAIKNSKTVAKFNLTP